MIKAHQKIKITLADLCYSSTRLKVSSLLSIHSEMVVILLILCGSLEIDKALDVTLEQCLLVRGWGPLGGLVSIQRGQR